MSTSQLTSTADPTGEGPEPQPVGRFPGVAEGPGEPDVYDPGGNVAEWEAQPNRAGKTEGGIADRPADPKARHRPADASYTSCCVVRGAKR